MWKHNDIDYAFQYESVAQQNKLQMVHLPDELNLGAAGLDPFYGQAEVDLNYKRFASVNPQFTGARIGYGITIPSNAPHPDLAADFVAFLLGPQGQAIMQQDHQPLFVPAVADGYSNVPAALRSLSTPSNAP